MIETEANRRRIKRARADARNLLSAQFISSVAKEFSIASPTQKAELSKFLRTAAWLYWDAKRCQGEIPRISAMRRKLYEISDLAARLKGALASIDTSSASFFWYQQRHLLQQVYADKEFRSPFGHTIVQELTADDTESVRFLNEQQLTEAVDVLCNLANDALNRLERDKGGQPANQALDALIDSCHEFWTKCLKRKFTFDGHRGQGYTVSYRFCQIAISQLDSTISPQEISTAMRKVIRRRSSRRQSGPTH